MKLLPQLLLLLAFQNISVYANENAEEARWVVQSATWGTLSWIEEGGQEQKEEQSPSVRNMIVSHASDTGRIFLYIPYNQEFHSSITLSEASLNAYQFEGARCGDDANLDPEDPRCAKLTLSGTSSPITDDDLREIAKEALFTSHPQMENWPEDHHFQFYELKVEDIWMIASYGGGAVVTADDYYAATPTHHKSSFSFGTRKITEDNTDTNNKEGDSKVPTFPSAAAHARWLVSKSLWTTISTASSREENMPFGNIRSTVDGECLFASSGLPVFYLPTPDPTNLDIKQKEDIALSFSEAALPQFVNDDGLACGGMDPEDPTCAKISLQGHARPLEDDKLDAALSAFRKLHPRADWLGGGGAHTGGAYYTIHLHSIEFFSNYGGLTKLTVDDYLNYKPSPADYDHEEVCFINPPSDSSSSSDSKPTYGSRSGGKGGYHGHGEYESYGGHDHGDYHNDKVSSSYDHGEGYSTSSTENEHSEHGGNYVIILLNAIVAFFVGMALGVFAWKLSMGRKIRGFLHQESLSEAACPYDKVASLPARDDEEESIALNVYTFESGII